MLFLITCMAYILSIATASPPHRFDQSFIADQIVQNLPLSLELTDRLKKTYQQSAILNRYSVLKNLNWLLNSPTSKDRNNIYKEEAPKLAVKAAAKALKEWQEPSKNVTHVISVTCTGMMAPGIEYFLVKELGLAPSVKRIAINFMGCFGAFNGLTVAQAIVSQNVDYRVLLVCTELCTLHAQIDDSSDTFLANALFGDGAGACIIGGKGSKNPLWEIEERSSLLLDNSSHLMTWDVAESGYSMTLSAKVPVMIRKNILPFCQSLLGKTKSFNECLWAIHPGGKSILQAIEKECQLSPSQTIYSWETLKEYGNMSSATFLFVLEKSLGKPLPWTLGLAFGPGLSMEGVVLKC